MKPGSIDRLVLIRLVLVTLGGAAAVTAGACGVRASSAAQNENGGGTKAGATGNDNGAAVPAAPVAVDTVAVVERALPRTLTLTGSLIAHRESAVAADASGKVAATFVERGSRVRAGAPLVRLDRRQAALIDAEAQAQAAAAETQAALAEAECARAAKLLADGAINQAEHDRASSACRAAGFQVSAAAARRGLAGKTLGDLVVRAPFAGVVADRFVTAGEYLRPDSRVAVVVVLDPLRLELAVPEHALAAFGVGADVSFRVAAYPDETFTGRVRFVGASVRRASRDLLVEAVVANPRERLRPGMFAVAEVKLGEEVRPLIPRTALRTDDRAGNDRVFVLGADGRVQERLVQVGPAAGELVAVLHGLRAGDRVVRAPAAALRDGVAVAVAVAAPAPASTAAAPPSPPAPRAP